MKQGRKEKCNQEMEEEYKEGRTERLEIGHKNRKQKKEEKKGKE